MLANKQVTIIASNQHLFKLCAEPLIKYLIVSHDVSQCAKPEDNRMIVGEIPAILMEGPVYAA